MATVPTRLRLLRQARGLSQTALGTRAGLNLMTVAGAELNGRCSVETLVKLAIALGVRGDPERLLERTTDAVSLQEDLRVASETLSKPGLAPPPPDLNARIRLARALAEASNE